MSDFEKSVRNIDGLTAFEPKTLPAWLSDRLDDMFVGRDEGPFSDAEFVDAYLRGEWLEAWGTATIDGKEVYLSSSIATMTSTSFMSRRVWRKWWVAG